MAQASIKNKAKFSEIFEEEELNENVKTLLEYGEHSTRHVYKLGKFLNSTYIFKYIDEENYYTVRSDSMGILRLLSSKIELLNRSLMNIKVLESFEISDFSSISSVLTLKYINKGIEHKESFYFTISTDLERMISFSDLIVEFFNKIKELDNTQE